MSAITVAPKSPLDVVISVLGADAVTRLPDGSPDWAMIAARAAHDITGLSRQVYSRQAVYAFATAQAVPVNMLAGEPVFDADVLAAYRDRFVAAYKSLSAASDDAARKMWSRVWRLSKLIQVGPNRPAQITNIDDADKYLQQEAGAVRLLTQPSRAKASVKTAGGQGARIDRKAATVAARELGQAVEGLLAYVEGVKLPREARAELMTLVERTNHRMAALLAVIGE